MLFHVDIKMEPFRREDDDSFLEDIICQSREDVEYDGSQYLNDTGEGDADQLEQMTAQDDTTEVSIEIHTTYICTTSLWILFLQMLNVYEMAISPGIRIEEAKTETRLKEKDGGAYHHHLIVPGWWTKVSQVC